MGFKVFSFDQKQHINLTESAWLFIEDDMHNFYLDEKNRQLSGFLNRIFKNFHEHAQASISIESSKLSMQMENLLSASAFKDVDSKIKRRFSQMMIHTFETESIQSVTSYPKGEGRKFRINNENLGIIEDLMEDRYYDGSLGLYLKALFEEYARKPYYERERIFFSDYVEIIEQAIDKNLLLKVTLDSNRKFYLKPYSIVMDKYASFNYLVGYGQPIKVTDVDEEHMSSFRLSRIQDIKILQSKSGKIGVEKQKKLQQELNIKGPQFLTSEAVEIRIRLNKKGIEKYRTQIHLRPQYTRIENNQDYIFSCTETQAYYYFFKFGKDAVVLSPKSLRAKFKFDYETAINEYNNKEEDIQ